MSSTGTTTKAHEILAQVEEKFGFQPNLIKQMVEAPATARVYLGGQEAMADASLTAREREAVQLAVAAHNECHYCRAAHSALGRANGIADDDVAAIAHGERPSDERLASLVGATRLTLEKRGWLDESDLAGLAEDGVDRRQLFEIIGLIGLKTISNYINHIAGTEIDPELA